MRDRDIAYEMVEQLEDAIYWLIRFNSHTWHKPWEYSNGLRKIKIFDVTDIYSIFNDEQAMVKGALADTAGLISTAAFDNAIFHFGLEMGETTRVTPELIDQMKYEINTHLCGQDAAYDIFSPSRWLWYVHELGT